jgi:hypothetical protein
MFETMVLKLLIMRGLNLEHKVNELEGSAIYYNEGNYAMSHGSVM